ncbi:MAG: hypothetical protein WAR79_00435 [Melioribacteraceae bacterium]
MTKLKILLNEIEYGNKWKTYELKIEEIISNYNLRENTIKTYAEYRKLLANFMKQIWMAFFDNPNSINHIDEGILINKALETLKNTYHDDTDLVVFKIMNTGAEGGVYQVLKTLAKNWINNLYNQHIRLKISEFVEKQTWQERENTAKEYLNEFKDILPNNFISDPLQIAVSLKNVLIEHPKMIKRINELSNLNS